MDEYIKREDVIKHLRGACIAKYPQSFSYGIFASADEISKLPTADVAPKSEVEMLQGALKAEERHNELTMEMAKKALANAKSDVAREIFEEIDKIFVDYKIDRCLEKCGLRLIVSNGEGIEQRFAELKKKYTEEQV